MFPRLREYIRSIYARDPAARSALEIFTTYPGVHALGMHRMSHRLWVWRWHWLARVLSHFGRWLTGIEIHPGAKIGRRFFIDHGMGVVIGETAEIGDDCTLYQGVTLGGTTWHQEKRHPTLGDNVVVGAGAKILGPLHIGAGARIGSNSVVVKDVPAGATIVGIPGRVVVRVPDEKHRQREAIAKKIGFEAYGQASAMPDPVAQAFNTLLDHLHVLDQRFEQIYAALKKAGVDIGEIKLPELTELTLGEFAEQKPSGVSPPLKPK